MSQPSSIDGRKEAAPPKPGILFVSSIVLHPDKLNPHDFCDWYEDTHIQEVQSTGGISGTQRYESLKFRHSHRDQDGGVLENKNFKYDFLTIYNMPDLAFRESAAFRSLDGQSKPNDDLLEGLFKQTEFTTRFCEKLKTIPISNSSASTAPASFMITIGVPSRKTTVNLVSMFTRLPPYGRVVEFKIHENSVLSAFERSYPSEPGQVVIVEYDLKPDLGEVREAIAKASEDLEIGFWSLRREYAGSERTPAGWSVPKK